MNMIMTSFFINFSFFSLSFERWVQCKEATKFSCCFISYKQVKSTDRSGGVDLILTCQLLHTSSLYSKSQFLVLKE